jgi:hypothetical protein
MWTIVSPRIGRSLAASIAPLAVSALLVAPAFSDSVTGTQASVDVAVVPGFTPPAYPGFHGVPPLPVSAPQLSAYHFTALATGDVTTAALASYDTVLLYGIRWSDISPTGQAAINTFAHTHKVLIWDADATGSQQWTTFIHPFSDTASGENYPGKPNDSVVSFPHGTNFLASDKTTSFAYINPRVLVTDRDLINDMNAMTTGTKNWAPSLLAANKGIPHGGWPLAWSYGVIRDHTGMTIYSGIDADAFASEAQPYAVKALAIQLKAAFASTPAACAPDCHLPAVGVGQTYASCSFAKPIPGHWVHGNLRVALQTSVAAGVTGKIVTRAGRVVAAGSELSGDVIHLKLATTKLPTNHVSWLRARVFVNGRNACTKRFSLKVDNTPPRILFVSISGGRLNIQVSEPSFVSYEGRSGKPVLVAAGRTNNLRLPSGVRSATVVVRDRAGNRVTRRVSW